ncbi:MAG: XRE family transcriptional regulator [Acetobacteraceae bacterium]|nr:XRE family transcriptional regulator [Acetobacteraceae bacterium]MBV8525175.1 XRE family transcriptional regulator [Acetobacteraceae bacterium]
MSEDEEIEIVPGTGNVFRDLNLRNPDVEQLRAILGARIIRVLDEKGLTARQAQELTGVAAADFSRIRRARLDRFTIDRLLAILDRLGQQVDISVTVHPRAEEVPEGTVPLQG